MYHRTRDEVTEFARMGITFGEMIPPARMASAPPQGPEPPPPPPPPTPKDPDG